MRIKWTPPATRSRARASRACNGAAPASRPRAAPARSRSTRSRIARCRATTSCGRLACACDPVRLQAYYLYDEGEDSSAFYVVLSGSLKDLGTAVIKSDGEVLGFDDYSLTRPRHAAVVALDRVVAVIFTQRTLDAIGRRDAHVLSTIVRAAASSGHDQL